MPFEFQTKNIRNDISNIDMSMGGVGMVVLHHKHTQGVAHPIGNRLLRHGVLCCVLSTVKKPLVPFEFQTNGIINGISNTDMSMGGLGVVVLHHKQDKASLIPLAITSCGMVCCAVLLSHR